MMIILTITMIGSHVSKSKYCNILVMAVFFRKEIQQKMFYSYVFTFAFCALFYLSGAAYQKVNQKFLKATNLFSNVLLICVSV